MKSAYLGLGSNLGNRMAFLRSGRDALAKAVSERPDLIFLDIIMQDMDGFQTCRKLSAAAARHAQKSPAMPGLAILK